MTKTKQWKVGDQLAFSYSRGEEYFIETIHEITPSGRIRCGNFELNPDLTVRGKRGWNSYRRAEPVTPHILACIDRSNNLTTIGSCRFNRLDNDTLAKVAQLIKSATPLKDDDDE